MLSCTKLISRVKCKEHKVNSRDRRKASDYIPLAFIYFAFQKKMNGRCKRAYIDTDAKDVITIENLYFLKLKLIKHSNFCVCFL